MHDKLQKLIEAGLREKDTDKLNFNPTKILSSLLVTNSWFTKTTTLSHYRFSSYEVQHTYSLNHIALENLFLLSLLATRYLTRRYNNCLSTLQHLCGFAINQI